jgi:threonine dehydratase
MKYEGKKKYLLVTFPQRPGALREFLSYLGPDDDIVRFEYLKKTNKERAPALIGIECQSDIPRFTELYEKLRNANIGFQDLTENQLLFDLLI